MTPHDPKLGSDPDPDLEHHGEVFESWLHEQDLDLQELQTIAKNHSHSTHHQSQPETNLTQSIPELVARVMSHYERYYRAKSKSVKQDVELMLNPDWRSHLEGTFMWLGGWRPTMAFHLLYSKAGLQFEDGLDELLSGISMGDLRDLTPSQLALVDELQRKTIKEERKLTERLAAHQETVADSSMVKLSDTAMSGVRDKGVSELEERVQSALAPKERVLEEIFGKADDLRMRTLRDVVAILRPIQAVHMLIAAAQLHLKVHEWGKIKDLGRTVNGQARGRIGDHGPNMESKNKTLVQEG